MANDPKSDDSPDVAVRASTADNAVSVQETTALVQSFFESVGGSSLSNFDGDARNRWRLTAICQAPTMHTAESLNGLAFPVKYWYAHKVRVFQPQGGEYIDATRVVLMNPLLETLAFTSDGIAQALVGMIQAFGMRPYDPPVSVQVQQITTRLGRKTYTLVPAEA